MLWGGNCLKWLSGLSRENVCIIKTCYLQYHNLLLQLLNKELTKTQRISGGKIFRPIEKQKTNKNTNEIKTYLTYMARI